MKTADTIPLLEITECFNNICHSKIIITKLMERVKINTVDTILQLENRQCSNNIVIKKNNSGHDPAAGNHRMFAIVRGRGQALQLGWVCVCVSV
jgi:hypothetical protein